MDQKIRPINAKRWRDELNSEAFISGLETAIHHSQENDREMGYKVKLVPGGTPELVYPMKILVGNQGKVNIESPMHYGPTVERYEQETGLTLALDIHGGWRVRKICLLEEGKEEQVREEIRLTQEWLAENDCLISFPFPKTEDWIKKNEENYSRKLPDLPMSELMYMDLTEFKKKPAHYIAVQVHTHPRSKVSPSDKDLKYLNSDRRWNLENFNIDSRISEESLIPNPVSIIVGAKAEKTNTDHEGEIYNIMIFQERTKQPISSDTSFVRLSSGFTEEQIINYRGFLGESPDPKDLQELSQEVKDTYNILHAIYDPVKKTITLKAGENWDTLCERI